MAPQSDPTLDDARYLALKAHDARFDGTFFTGVTSTGIYCRPVCRVKTPKRENCRFFGHAALAEAAGFRPCLRCRPELAPESWQDTLAWSTEDATRVLAREAARLLKDCTQWPVLTAPVAQVAARLGVSERHLHRLFLAHWGLAPLQYLQTQRLLQAKLLLTDTRLPVAEVAALSGYASLRRFHEAWQTHYRLSPLQLRKESRAAAPAPASTHPALTLHLAYRPPYDLGHLLRFLAQRAMTGVEFANEAGVGAGTAADPHWASTLAITQGAHSHAGWVSARWQPQRQAVLLQVAETLAPVLPQVLLRVRHALDLDLQPDAVDASLGQDFPDTLGQRVPGGVDPFALAVRAVLGQQVTVAAARTLAQRLVARWGTPIDTPFAALTHLFPTPQVLARASGDELGRLGITRQRQAAIVALSQAVCDGHIQLQPQADAAPTLSALQALPGIGAWTAHYIAMRALRWPDAFPAGDVAVHKALGLQDAGLDLRAATRAAETLSQAWRPWRSYAVVRAWGRLKPAPQDPIQKGTK